MNTKQTSGTRITIVGLMLALLLVSLDSTILSTAIPTIVVDLGGMAQFFWVFSAYMVASAAGMPIFGKLSDQYGRKLFFVLGLILFMIGSLLCGSSQSMTQLILYRVLQGIGGGALMPVIFTIIFDLFPPDKRGKIVGLFSSVFGLSSVLGPLAGAFFSDHLHWRWIFYINLPLGIASLLLVAYFYRESFARIRPSIDWAGTLLLIGSILCLMFALEWGGKQYSWSSPLVISLFTASGVLLLVFLWVETRAADPLIPLSLFKKKLFVSSMAIGVGFGMILMGGASLIPLFIQGVNGGSATNAGIVLMPMMLSLVAGSTIGGIFLSRTAYRNLMLPGVTCLLASVILLSLITPDTARWLITLDMILMGLGIGISFPVSSLMAQDGIGKHQRGTVNSLVRFSQALGNTLGISLLGSLQTNALTTRYGEWFVKNEPGDLFRDPEALLNQEMRSTIPAGQLDQLTGILSDSIAYAFMWAVPIVIVTFIFILWIGNAKIEKKEPIQPVPNAIHGR
ncbi:MDR family MFS transporter [Paenibacillus sp. J2TS4]|uniref:MDR family MFS transporter n=1 Tax=Paenibacillus sp. J2TS4 TaxID=2807194 RepID=UPI001B053775|nr:MDR family MFS transporter [Paenibacillus sp. J2TS4]GIP32483.1 MFS transporter [Paenibacillus sp. J2TS4]